MKKIKAVLYLTLPMTLFLLIACQRVYDDGETQEVSWVSATYDVIFGKPARKQIDIGTLEKTGDPIVDAKVKVAIEKHNAGAKDDKESPDNGMIPLLTLLGSLAGVGEYTRTFLNKRNAEKARDLATHEKRQAQVRYQAAKDVVRDEDADLLDKMKDLAGIASKTVTHQKKLYDQYADDIEGVRAAYTQLTRKNS